MIIPFLKGLCDAILNSEKTEPYFVFSYGKDSDFSEMKDYEIKPCAMYQYLGVMKVNTNKYGNVISTTHTVVIAFSEKSSLHLKPNQRETILAGIEAKVIEGFILNLATFKSEEFEIVPVAGQNAYTLSREINKFDSNNECVILKFDVTILGIIGLCVLPPIVVTPPLFDEAGLVFDFDFEQISKMGFSNSNGAGVISFTDRGVVLEQNRGDLFCPQLTPDGLYFDGVYDFMNITVPNFAEIFIVCNNTSLVDEDVALFFGDIEIALYADGSMLDLVYGSEIRVNNIISNIGSFLPKEIFKSVSLIRTLNFTEGFVLGGYWDGNIKRILIFDSPRTELQRTVLQAYLAQRYSL